MTHLIESVVVEIDAPASFVWNVLLDYPHYPQWNPYTLAVATTLEIDSPIDLTLPRPDGGEGTFVSREYIREVEPPRLLRYDTGDTFPGLLGTRDQLITPLGPQRCSYRTFETFTGKYADAIFAAQGAYVKNGFDSVAHALRDRVKALLRV
ncbi:SRPBCC domain-containing protein [Lentzea flaviverrucosa]|uniref:Polyketide cyclase / dehydrase and lipid transport n=1 Tax=Lentzea flaviverrucosa TaxID=200379 RepID=A0A1H9XUJ7_9PSEU|nr:SRPBCC domain-containing protein [Lentzea flaviverrucosa]RDI19187.1 polyketide cyclase/dehydrase/lipid transport protein [Lentzea flaviverrucosa]SES49447.1 Polyketide cyclase / dehydrase and lipid transport [Lentzea flaviverrucosa]